MKEFAERLLAITEGCRDDMLDPYNQGLIADVEGTVLTNEAGNTGLESEILVQLTRYAGIVGKLSMVNRDICEFNHTDCACQDRG